MFDQLKNTNWENCKEKEKRRVRINDRKNEIKQNIIKKSFKYPLSLATASSSGNIMEIFYFNLDEVVIFKKNGYFLVGSKLHEINKYSSDPFCAIEPR